MTNPNTRSIPVSGVSDLAELLALVEDGTSVLLTRSGRTVAVLAPPASAGGLDPTILSAEAPAAYAPPADRPMEPPTALLRLVGGAAARAVLGVFVREPQRAIHQREIARRAGVGLRSAQLALAHLESLGLIASERDGNRLYYRANRSERFEGLLGLLAREFGIAGAIARVLEPLGSRVRWAFIFGSAAEGRDTVDSDVDLLVVGDVSLRDLATPLADAQRELAREIDLVLYSPKDFQDKRAAGNHLIKTVLAGPRIEVAGGPH